MKTYVYHTDAGHGWLAVKRKELVDLGILNKISHYSYQNGGTVYLEEDCDAGHFLEAKKAKGEEVGIKHSYREHSHVRYYASFTPEVN